MSFRDIKGQDRAVTFLKNSIARGAVAQSYIFAGPKGTGRFMTALEFAKALICAAPADNDACDECSPCRKFSSKNHPDLVIVKPDEDSSGEVKIDMVRSVRYLINLKPYEMRAQVCIMDSADRMNTEASNAILKVLEEPPQESVLILIVENPANVLPTIASRCQTVRFFPLSADRLERILQDQYGRSEKEAYYMARLSSGSIGGALRFKDKDVFAKKNRVIDGFKSGAIFDEEKFALFKEEMPWVLDIMLSWCRDVLLAKVGADPSRYINIDRPEVISKEAEDEKVSSTRLIRLANDIIDCRFQLEYNVNAKLAWAVLGQKVLAGRRGDLDV